MSRFGLTLAAAAFLLMPKLASATVYTFADTESSALSPLPVSYSFSLDTATAVVSGSVTNFNNVTIFENGVASSGNTVGASFATDLSSPFFFLIDTSAQPFYAGSGTNLAFNPGSFAIADGATDGEGMLTISAVAVPAVPEPATWTLLCTGLTMLAAGRFSLRSNQSR